MNDSRQTTAKNQKTGNTNRQKMDLPSIPDSLASHLYDFSWVKPWLFLKVVSRDQDREKYADAIQYQFLDLMAVVCIKCTLIEDCSCAIILHPLLDKWDITAQELFKLALENTRKLYPHTLYTLPGLIKQISADIGNMLSDEMEIPLFVLSNTKLEYGASNLLYKEVLKRAGTEMECERYWILPSSIHECILVPCNIQFQDASMLRQLVIDINKKLIPGDFLSNSIYQFDCHTGCLSKIEESQEVIQWNMCLQ